MAVFHYSAANEKSETSNRILLSLFLFPHKNFHHVFGNHIYKFLPEVSLILENIL